MPRNSKFAVLITVLVAPLAFTGCQNGFGRTAKHSADNSDVYVNRARNVQLSEENSSGQVMQVGYQTQTPAVAASNYAPTSNYATDPRIGAPASGQYSPSQMESLSKPYRSALAGSSAGSSHRGCSSVGFG